MFTFICERKGTVMKRFILACVVLTVALFSVVAGSASAGVIPPHAMPHGASYGQWNARWWQWLYQTPVSINPVSNNPELTAGTPGAPAAVDCSAGQAGTVWFIGGTLQPTSANGQTTAADVYRTCTIPRGTFLFFPILNDEYDNLGCPNTTLNAAELTAQAAAGINGIVPGSMAATIDGVSVSGLADSSSIYRAPSPWFSYTLPADNIGPTFGCPFPAGSMPPPVDGHPGATADGIYLMLAPLRVGTHVIHFGGKLAFGSSGDFTQNINYTITVTPR